MEKYKVGKLLGDGTFGSVTKANDKKTGQLVAIKKMKRKIFKWDDVVRQPEIQSLIKLKHPNIVRLYEIIKHNNELFFVFEFMEKNVYQLLKDNAKPLSEQSIRNIFYQTLQGLAYIHKLGYFHRDMKPENLLILDNTVKIADFGLAKLTNAPLPYTDYVSTRWYRAPEVILRAPQYGPPIDIFAVGAIIAELYRCWPLFPGASETDQIHKICNIMGTPEQTAWPDGYKLAKHIGFHFPKCIKQSLKTCIPNASLQAIALMEKMMAYNPKERPTAIECLQHEFFCCWIPIPESVKLDNLEIYKKKEEETKKQEIPKTEKTEKTEKIEKIDKEQKTINSGLAMRNARYKPGVQPLKINK